MSSPVTPRPSPPPATPEELIAALDRATAASNDAVDESRRRARRLWIAVAVVVVIGAVLFWRQDNTNSRASAAQHKLKCVTDYLQGSADNSLGFFVAEWNKVNGQYEGFDALRTASLHHNPKASLAGFDRYLAATKTYRDGSVTKRLAFYGVTVVTDPDGGKHLDVSHAHAKAPCR